MKNTVAVLLALFVCSCGDSDGSGGTDGTGGTGEGGAGGEATADPLIGTWSGPAFGADPLPPAYDSNDETWVFDADGTASRTDVGVYNATVPAQEGCTETIVFTGFAWTTTGDAITLTGGSGTIEAVGCTDPASNHPPMPTLDDLMLDGTYAIVGDALTLTLNGSTVELTRE